MEFTLLVKQDTPHYYFYAPEMMIINKQEMVAKWIWLYFGGVPFPIPLPFAVFQFNPEEGQVFYHRHLEMMLLMDFIFHDSDIFGQ